MAARPAVRNSRRQHLVERELAELDLLAMEEWRFRPILMTTLCALLAGVPLMVGTGTGSEIRQPLGYAIVGGLLVSQLLTLFTTPVVYIYLARLSLWLNRRRTTALGDAATLQR